MSPSRKPRKPSNRRPFAQVESICIGGLHAHMGALGLHLYAEEFLNAAQALPPPRVPFEPVRPYLLCHAIELALKAYLSLAGASMLELAEGEYGRHRLSQLLMRAEGAGLETLVPLSESQRHAIHHAETYYAGKVFEYPAVGEALRAYPETPDIAVLGTAADVLVTSLAGPCAQAKARS